MAVLAIGALGAMIAPAGYAALGFSIGMGIGNMLFPPKQPDRNIEGPRLGDLRITQTAYGQGIPIIEGTMRVVGKPIWATARRETPHTSSQQVGSKGGGGQTVTNTTYSYDLDIAYLLCEGDIDGAGEVEGVDQIWANGELIYDVTPGASGDAVAQSSALASRITVYPGNFTQDLDPTIEAVEGVDDTSAYLGLAYIMLQGFKLDRWNGQLPQMEFRVVKSGTTAANAQNTIGDVGLNNVPQVLGAGGSVYGQPDSSLPNAGVRWSVYAGAARVTVYPAVLFGYSFSGVYPTGEGVSVNYGGYLVIARNDGSADVYSGAAGGLSQVAFESDVVAWGQGNGAGSQYLYRMVLNPAAKTISNTLISGSRSERLFRNACGIPGRLYTLAAGGPAGAMEVGYVNTSSYGKVPLIVGINYGNKGLISRDGFMWLSTTTAAQKWTADGVLVDSLTYPASAQRELLEDSAGLIWAMGGSSSYVIHPASLTIVQSLPSISFSTVLGFTEDNRLVTYSGSLTHLLKEVEKLPRLTAGTTTVGAFLTKLCARVGLSPAQLDVSAMTATLHGLMFTDRPEVSAIVDELMRAYGSDVVESGGKLKFVPRGGASLVTIPEEDIGAFADSDEAPVAALQITDKYDPELPEEIALSFFDRTAAYQQNTQYARRLIGHSRNRLSVNISLAFSPDEGQQCVQRMMDDAWAARRLYSLTVPRKYAKYEPGDVVTPIYRGRAHPMKLLQTVQDAGMVRWEAQSDESIIAMQNGVGGAHTGVTSMTIVSAPTQLVMLDIPLMRDLDDGFGPYIAMAGYAQGWPGAELFRSVDDGASYQQAGLVVDNPAVIGSALTALGTFAGGNVFDEQNAVTVVVGDGMTLVSYTRDQVHNGFGAFALGAAGRFEILQYRDATLVGTRTYKLTGLLRGRKGTEQHMGSHAIGDQFVLLQSTTIRRYAGVGDDLNVARKYKAVGFGRTLDETVATAFANTAVALKPLSPVLLGGGRDAAGTVYGKFVRRTRMSAEWPDYVEAPLGEASAAYEVEIWNSGFSTLKRTLTATPTGNGSVVTSSPTAFVYDDGDQITDWGSVQATVYVRVYQLSAAVGRGFALQGTV